MGIFIKVMKNKEWSEYFDKVKTELTGKKEYVGFKFRETVFESKKVYFNKIAFNLHDDWFKFDTMYRTKKGFARKIHCRDKRQVVELLMLFIRFQTLIGVTDSRELKFHSIYFLGHVPVFDEKVFPLDKDNFNLIDKLIERVLTTEPKEDVISKLKDTRKFSIEDDGVMDGGSKNTITRKATRIYNRLMIHSNYDESKSVSENARNLGYTRPTIYDYLENRKQVEQIYEKVNV